MQNKWVFSCISDIAWFKIAFFIVPYQENVTSCTCNIVFVCVPSNLDIRVTHNFFSALFVFNLL